MDFVKLLKIAENNKAVAEYESNRKQYCDTTLPPPKKLPKANIQSDAIKKFLARKQAEERQKAEEAKKKKAELLALREMSKTKTKARIMASRTKDNDFSRIKLTEQELEAKKRMENELLKLSLNDKVARMKARIELEEKEKLLPKKRKRKSKHHDADYDGEHHDTSSLRSSSGSGMQRDKNEGKETMHKKPKPPPPLSYRELLELAERNQFQPVTNLPVSSKENDDRPMTKKARRLLQEEENSIRRKLAEEAAEKKGSHVINSIPNENVIKKLPKIALKKRPASEQNSTVDSPKVIKKGTPNGVAPPTKKPHVVHVQNQNSNNNQNKFSHVSSGPSNNSSSLLKSKPALHQQNIPSNNQVKPAISAKVGKVRVAHQMTDKHKERPVPSANIKVAENGLKKSGGLQVTKKVSSGTTNKAIKQKVAEPSKTSNTPQNNGKVLIDDEIMAEIERRVRSQVQKELEAKLMLQQQNINRDSVPKSNQLANGKSECRTKTQPKPQPQVNPNKPKPDMLSKNKAQPGEKRTLPTQKLQPKVVSDNAKPGIIKKPPCHPALSAPKAKLPPKPAVRPEKPRKPAFHPNPYLEPPRRLLESRIPPKPIRRVESDDDEDEDDEEMNDFIDDGCGDTEDYSQYIKEIFNYDRSRYVDEDDDDIIETSFVDQMKEEKRSTIIAKREDYEEFLKEQEELKRKAMKKKKK